MGQTSDASSLDLLDIALHEHTPVIPCLRFHVRMAIRTISFGRDAVNEDVCQNV